MTEPHKTGSDLFIVDNSDHDWKVRSYLSEWCELSKTIDIATGYFEIGSLLCLKEKWQSIDHMRVLMGDEVSLRTKRAFELGLKRIETKLDDSLEAEKRQNDFLEGVPAIIEAIRSGKIECRVFRKDKFHAKAYITHGRAAVVGSFALVGSSNFTYPGLNENVELNVQIRGPEVGLLQDWYERHWEQAEDVTAGILRTLERHADPHTPFEIWFKALDEFFAGKDLDPDTWDREKSIVFPVLDRYQQDAYRNLMSIANRFGGAFLCDGVGLGKTYIGLMLIERFVFKETKNVVLFAPKAAHEDVWKPALEQYLGDVFSEFINLKIYNHTDLQRQGPIRQRIERTVRDADMVLIDEAHHFRNPGIKGQGGKAPSRYRLLQTFIRNSERPKQVYFLTATPVNNSIHDFRHTVELYTGGKEDYFASSLGVHNLRSHFNRLEKAILGKLPGVEQLDMFVEAEIQEAGKLLRKDTVFDSLVVQRSRAYVKESQALHGGNGTLFPERQLPQTVPYNLKAIYGRLLESVTKAFQKDKPLFVLGIYYPLAYWKLDKDSAEFKFDEGRQKQVVTLIRTLFLKRFESSAKAFEGSCWRLLQKLLAWVTVHAETTDNKRQLKRWKDEYGDLIGYVETHQDEFWPKEADEDEVEEFLTDDMLADVEKLDREKYEVDGIFNDSISDMRQLAEFLEEVTKVEPKRDDKLKALIKLLKTDRVLKEHKVIIFTEFAETARYLERELKKAEIEGIERIDGGSNHKQRHDAIQRFAPYYNGLDSSKLEADGKQEIRVLISTDVLSEGLNLQDATRIINYDLHWNPVRLMQRIGRVDRRMNPEVEKRIIADHPEQKTLRGKTAFWNFLPPECLDELLKLFQKVTNKVLVISRTLGIEGRSLLTPDDDFDPIREINEQCDGTLSEIEQLRIEYIRLIEHYPELAAKLANLPLKVFSGRRSPKPNSRAVFFCFRIPRPDPTIIETESGEPRWSQTQGYTVWICYDLEKKRILTDPAVIAEWIRSEPDTPRHCEMERPALSELRRTIERQLVNDHLRPLQAPAGITPILKCWMELN